MARRQANALGRDQIKKRIMRRGHHIVDLRHHALILMRARHREHSWVFSPNTLFFHPQASRNDHLAIFAKRLADGI